MRADAHRTLVQSAAHAGMNTLRVWGGGIFLPGTWFDACDELGAETLSFLCDFMLRNGYLPRQEARENTYRNLNGKDVSAAGIMIYHDMMYPGHPEHAPANTTDQVHKRTHNHALNFAKTDWAPD
jgi:hypothetical protein